MTATRRTPNVLRHVSITGLRADEQRWVERLVERMREGGWPMLRLQQRLPRLLADAAHLAGNQDEARQLELEIEQLVRANNAPPVKE